MKRFVTLWIPREAVAGMTALLAAGCGGDGGKGPDGPAGQTDGPPGELPTVYVNEVMADNATVLQDELGSFPDWIELYNPNPDEVDLGGWYLTDETSEPTKWRIPDGIVIPAEGFLVFFADSDTEEGDLHTSFNLDADGGEDVALFGPLDYDNVEVDALEDMTLQVEDVSLARHPDGGPTWEIEADVTPGASNG